MSNNHPITFVKAGVLAPAVAMSDHPAIQQYFMAMGDDEYQASKCVAAIRTDDMKRLFGEILPQAFYLFNPSYIDAYLAGKAPDERSHLITYCMLRGGATPDMSEEELFADVVVLHPGMADRLIKGGILSFMHDFTIEHDNADFEAPILRLKLLSPKEQLEEKQPAMLQHFQAIDLAAWQQTNIHYKFDLNMLHWIKNDDPIVPVVEKRRLHLKDIPLDNRNGRRLVRESIEQSREKLTNLFIKSGAQITFNEWMIENQGVRADVLDELEKIDALPDDQYVAAMVSFKKGEAQAYHSQAVKDGKTTLHLFDWVLENFGVEFEELGRQEALAEIINLDGESEQDEAGSDEEASPGVFVVQFDGTVVEDHFPMIGAESPFAVATLRKLIEKGHKVIIATKRENDTLEMVFEFFESSDVKILGTIKQFPSSGCIHPVDVWFGAGVGMEEIPTEDIEVDYLIDHRLFGTPMVQISGRAEYAPTFYWGDLIGHLQDSGYLTEDEVNEIMESMAEQQ